MERGIERKTRKEVKVNKLRDSFHLHLNKSHRLETERQKERERQKELRRKTERPLSLKMSAPTLLLTLLLHLSLLP
jgi:uncharacterized C2H2 Zn-finger protein